ncbi:tetratricopeptide repeat protein, partial [Patescibacteria group bacterium]|nr:tetratricopeptide repeat protein [Patescibacteria group bacterium]
AIHIINGMLIFLILDAFLKKRGVALIAVFLFLVHPLQVEAVTYISGRGFPMAVMFMLLSLIFFLIGERQWPGKEQISFPRIYSALSYFCAVAAILSMENGFLFPLYLVLFLMTFVYRDGFARDFKRSIAKVLPYGIISLLYLLTRMFVLRIETVSPFFGAPSGTLATHFAGRLYTFLALIPFYLQIILAPLQLRVGWAIRPATSFFDLRTFAGAIILMVILAVIILDFKRTRLWFFCWGIFFGSLLLTSFGVSPLSDLFYEHWLYFSLFGIVTLGAWYGEYGYRFLAQSGGRFWSVALAGLFFIWVVFLAVQTIKMNLLWGDPKTVYQNIIQYEPTNGLALNNLGTRYFTEGRKEEALAIFATAVNAGVREPLPYYNLGNYFWEKKDYDNAIMLYQRAIELDKNFYLPYNSLLGIYLAKGATTTALYYLSQLNRFEIYDPFQNYHIGGAALKLGQMEIAKKAFQRVVRYADDNELDDSKKVKQSAIHLLQKYFLN